MHRIGLSLALLALPLPAQSLQVDFGPASGGPGVALTNYGAAANAVGVWNPVGALTASSLLSTGGVPTGVDLTITTVPTSTFFGTRDVSSGADEALLDDFIQGDVSGIDFQFSGLAPGFYAAWTILVEPINMFAQQVYVPGSLDPSLYVGGAWNGSGYVQGSSSFGDQNGNYSRQTLLVTNGTLTISVYSQGFVDQVVVQGIQLVQLDAPAVPQCFGDGNAFACPCTNNGQPAHGCENSAGTGGALLSASGTTSPDTLVLQSQGELASALSIFLQGNATIAAASFGDGLRCAGGILKRLYVKSASGGVAVAPGLGDPPITVRSAALGDIIPSGERRYYQVYYRDPSPGFCPAPAGGTYNVSNALKVVW